MGVQGVVLHTCVRAQGWMGKHAGGCLHVDVGLCTLVHVHLDVCDCAKHVCTGMWGFAHLCVSTDVCVSVQGVLTRECGVLHQGFCADCELARWAFARGCGALHTCLCARVCVSVQGVFARERGVLHQGFLCCCECARGARTGMRGFAHLRVCAHGCVSV